MSDTPEQEVDPAHPNDPLRVELPMEAWPPGQEAVTPLSQWGPAPAGSIDRAWFWKPQLLRGYVPKLMRLSIRVRSAATHLYSATNSPRWLVAFLDPGDDASVNSNEEYLAIPAGMTDPLTAEVLIFELPGVIGVASVTNNGNGYEFPMRTPLRYCGIWVSAIGIGIRAECQVTPVIQYVRKGVGQGG
jgi:hypothetical protein